LDGTAGWRGPGFVFPAGSEDAMKNLEYWQGFVPSECDWKQLVDGNGDVALSFAQESEGFIRRMYATSAWACGLKAPQEEFDLVTSDRFATSVLGSGPAKLRQLEFLVRASRARRVLEVGTFIGISALYLARALPPGGEVVTLEKFDHFAAIARDNFARNGMADHIRLIEGDALESLSAMGPEEKFGLIYLDGDKGKYPELFRLLEPMLEPDGMIIVDDIFFHGDAIREEPVTDKGQGVRALLDDLSRRSDLFRCVLPIGVAGMLLVMRR
jgi:predicted O-methyltransferase YrrM